MILFDTRWPCFHCCGLDSESYKLNDAYQTVIQSLNKTSNQRVFPIDRSSLSFSSAGAWEHIQILYHPGLGLYSTLSLTWSLLAGLLFNLFCLILMLISFLYVGLDPKHAFGRLAGLGLLTVSFFLHSDKVL